MTFSILGHCRRSGMFGIAVSSSSPAVAARCAHARAGIGAVGTQNITDPRLGPRGLDLLAEGLGAQQALESLKSRAEHLEFRQIVVIDREGGSAAFSGARTLGTHAEALADNAASAGNLLANADVPKRILASFLEQEGRDLGDRLIGALSAGLIMVRDVAWHVADLRVDWHEHDPIGELAALWQRWKPQMEDYVTRALDPRKAPSYGVPGDR